jgi:hypothetical protein
MSRKLLMIGGAIQLLFGFFHIWLGVQIQTSQEYPGDIRSLLQVFNIGACLLIFFFAYISFFCYNDLMTSILGKAALILAAGYYFIRAIDEFIFFESAIVIFIPCFLVGSLYVYLLIISNSGKSIESD